MDFLSSGLHHLQGLGLRTLTSTGMLRTGQMLNKDLAYKCRKGQCWHSRQCSNMARNKQFMFQEGMRAFVGSAFRLFRISISLYFAFTQTVRLLVFLIRAGHNIATCRAFAKPDSRSRNVSESSAKTQVMLVATHTAHQAQNTHSTSTTCEGARAPHQQSHASEPTHDTSIPQRT